MGMAERLSECVTTSDLQSKDERIRDVELVASLAGCTHLGSDMMRAKDYDSQALRRAILRLTAKAIKTLRISRGPAQLLATTALLEVMHWQCRRCNGASEQIIGGIRQVCPECEGAGIHRWSNNERARTSGYPVETWHQWAPKYERIIGMARNADSWTVIDAARRLG
jgi:hypothetical protein